NTICAILLLLAAIFTAASAQSFTVTSDLSASSAPTVSVQVAQTSGYNASIDAQVHLAAGASIDYPFSEIDWGDGSFTRGTAISTPQGETHTYPKTTTRCSSSGSRCSYTLTLLITDSKAASATGTTYVSMPISSQYPSGGSSGNSTSTTTTTISPATTTTINPTTTIPQSSTTQPLQSTLCGIVALLNMVLYTLALALFVIGGVLYTLAHTLPSQARGMMQGYGAGIMMGGISVAIIALIAPYVLALFLGGGLGAAALC
ncbi:MAG: PKD domain-containing protein, partial [Candidatus Micrarchaeota archaeon]|nr:PKD domain-containing protein [Candidatus Micrarchaeota archaeon]